MGFADVMGYYGGFCPPPALLPLIPNKGWESGDFGGWIKGAGSSSVGVTTVGERSGSYCLRIYNPSLYTHAGQVYYDNPEWAKYIGKTIQFTIYNKLVPGYGYGSQRFIEINDGPTNTQQAFTIPCTTYQLTTVQHTVNASANQLRFRIYTAGASYGYYIDDMDAVVL